ncbi:ABC transporter permease [Bordetella genomosp. 13]|uniref:ABC transporter permease n=1 Tax=Bordetella genomosp. 13 TaxID=463040 RepID=UPI0011A32056|nr:ABC transporter permease [Bordetella genomosp. 13]
MTQATSSPAHPLRYRPVFRTLNGVFRILLISIPVFLFATLITFLLRELSGISPLAFVAGEDATPALMAEIQHRWGLDQPVFVQYLDWLLAIFRGDLGLSWKDSQSVSEILWQKAPISLSITFFALAIGVVFGTVFGLLAALKRGTWVDRAITVATSAVSALPSFVIGIVLIAVFAVGFRLFPSGGYVSFEQDPGAWLARITLPAIALSLDTVSDIARQLRTGIVGAYGSNYVTGARLRGLSESQILWTQVLRNGVGPALTVLGMKFPTLLGGAVITESIFHLPGYGIFTAAAAQQGDVPVVQGALIFSIVLVLVFNLIVNAVLNRLTPAAQRGI